MPADDPTVWNPIGILEALVLWDRDEMLMSVAMGDIGPWYEQQIQLIAFECLRFLVPLNVSELSSLQHTLETTCHAAALRFGWVSSPAQAALAVNLAAMAKRHGWQAAVRKAPPERRIVVKRSFP